MIPQTRYPLASIILMMAVPTSCFASYLLIQTGIDWMVAFAAVMPPFVFFCWIFTTIRAAHLAEVYFWSLPSTYASLFGGVACIIFLLIAAATSTDSVSHQFHAAPSLSQQPAMAA